MYLLICYRCKFLTNLFAHGKDILVFTNKRYISLRRQWSQPDLMKKTHKALRTDKQRTVGLTTFHAKDPGTHKTKEPQEPNHNQAAAVLFSCIYMSNILQDLENRFQSCFSSSTWPMFCIHWCWIEPVRSRLRYRNMRPRRAFCHVPCGIVSFTLLIEKESPQIIGYGWNMKTPK